MDAPERNPEGPAGHTYAAVLVRSDDRAAVLQALRDIRFSGWLSTSQDGWLVAVTASGDRAVASGRRGVVGVGEWLAGKTTAPVLAVRVLRDRQLVLVAWTGGDEVARYMSDPSAEPGADKDVLDEPLGAEDAEAIAVACGHPDAAEDLGEVLVEELDPDSFIESERLGRVLRLLSLPTWVVAAATLPKAIPTGPDRHHLTRLGAGIQGPTGLLAGRLTRSIRRRMPPPVITDVPRRTSGMDPWLY